MSRIRHCFIWTTSTHSGSLSKWWYKLLQVSLLECKMRLNLWQLFLYIHILGSNIKTVVWKIWNRQTNSLTPYTERYAIFFLLVKFVTFLLALIISIDFIIDFKNISTSNFLIWFKFFNCDLYNLFLIKRLVIQFLLKWDLRLFPQTEIVFC